MTMAEATKLTETMITKARLGPQQKQKILWDTAVTGFALRILAGGSKTFWFQYRPSGGRSVSSRMVRIGPWPSVSLTDARKAARAYAGAVARGDDPAADKQEERRRASSTLRTLLAEGGEYERHLKRRHIVNTKSIMSTFRRGLGRLMGKDVAAITRADFVTAVVAIEDQGKPGAAANVLAGLRQSKTTRAERLASQARKPRALADHEIVAVWNAAAGRGAFGNIIRLLLLTGARRGEIAKLTRDRILSDRLVLPPTHTKMGQKHEVPLTDLTRAVIAAQPTTVSTLVFASEKTGRAFNGWGKSVTALQRAAGVTFTPHDLRRTCRTLMSRLGVEPDIAELAIGHKRTGLDRLYNFDQAWQLRCDAFAKVSDHVAALIGVRAGAAVIPL